MLCTSCSAVIRPVVAFDLDGSLGDYHNHFLNFAEGYLDRWIVYGKIDGQQLFTAKELTVGPGVKATIKDTGAYGLICVQGTGTINRKPLNSPALIRFHELTEDEYFVTEEGARRGVTYENRSETEPLVVLRYFGPEANPEAPDFRA